MKELELNKLIEAKVRKALKEGANKNSLLDKLDDIVQNLKSSLSTWDRELKQVSSGKSPYLSSQEDMDDLDNQLDKTIKCLNALK